MIGLPPVSTLTDTRCPYSTLFRSFSATVLRQLPVVVRHLVRLLGVPSLQVGGAVADVRDDRVALRLDVDALGRLVRGDVLEEVAEAPHVEAGEIGRAHV